MSLSFINYFTLNDKHNVRGACIKPALEFLITVTKLMEVQVLLMFHYMFADATQSSIYKHDQYKMENRKKTNK